MTPTTAESLVEGGLFSVEEAMEFLSISRSHLYELMNQQQIPWVKIGRSRRIPKKFLVSYLAANLKGVDPLSRLG